MLRASRWIGRCVLLGALTVTSAALAGSGGRVNANGTIELTAKFMYPPDQQDIDHFKSVVSEASQILCDATDGQARISKMTITGGSGVGVDHANILLLAEEGRSTASLCWQGNGVACSSIDNAGSHVNLRTNNLYAEYNGWVLAHELGHLVFDIGDEYDEQSRVGACWGIGRSIECSDESSVNTTMMGRVGGCYASGTADATELTVPANHDTIQGDPAIPSCTPLNQQSCNPPRPCSTNCPFWNPSTCRFDLSHQSAWSFTKFGTILSDWEQLTTTRSEYTAPAGYPDPDPPASCSTQPQFVVDVEPADQVFLVLDSSWSMNFAPSVGQCSGAGCPDLCDNNYDDDQDGLADEQDPQGCDGRETRMDYLRSAVTWFIFKHRGSGTILDSTDNAAGIVSFACSANTDVEMQSLTYNSSDETFFPTINGLSPGGSTAIGRALDHAANDFPTGQDASQNRAILLVTDGHDNCPARCGGTCLDPGDAADQLDDDGIPLYTILTGEASSDDQVGSLPGRTGGVNVDSEDPTELVNAFAEQWANYAGAGLALPRLPFVVSVFGPTELPDSIRDSHTWLDGGEDPFPCAPLAPCQTDTFAIDVEPGVERINVVLAGDLPDMDGFRVRARLTGPPGPNPTLFDSEAVAPGPLMHVVHDKFWVAVEVEDPNPGRWQIEVSPAGTPGEPPIQSGNITVSVEHDETRLFAQLDRTIVNDPLVPVQLSVRPEFDLPILGADVSANLVRPDGSVVPLVLVDRTYDYAGYTAEIASMPFRGVYEIRILAETTAASLVNPGESIFDPPPNDPSVPLLTRTASRYFTVTTGTEVCKGPIDDCDGDDIIGESPINDTDGDGRPDDSDPDSDDDGKPDDFEWNGALVDTDGDGTTDPYDTDADQDGTEDEDDLRVETFGPYSWLWVKDTSLEPCGGFTYGVLGSDRPVDSIDAYFQFDDTLVAPTFELGPDIPAGSVASFVVTSGPPDLPAGTAEVVINFLPALPPGPQLRVLQVDLAVVTPSPSLLFTSFCPATGGPMGSLLTIEEGGIPLVVAPDVTCGTILLGPDETPPFLYCPDATIPADASCQATLDVTASSFDRCDPSPLLTSSPALPAVAAPGIYPIDYSATDSSGNLSECRSEIVVADVDPPMGGITGPAPGCYGGPVTVLDDFFDGCTPSLLLTRTYEPAGGPDYSSHGDHNVVLTVQDEAGNAAGDMVAFAIDTQAPLAAFQPGTATLASEGSLPPGGLFLTSDDDGATGGVVRERLLLAGCPLFDGATYGDGDGLLGDESLVFDLPTDCEALVRCGGQALDLRDLVAEAQDCGGNTGSALQTTAFDPPVAASACQAGLVLTPAGGATEVAFLGVFAADAFDLVRGDLGSLSPAGSTVDLGPLTCLGEDSTAAVTDPGVPAPGMGFFYLGRYQPLAGSVGYGFGTGEEPRAGLGGCSP